MAVAGRLAHAGQALEFEFPFCPSFLPRVLAEFTAVTEAGQQPAELNTPGITSPFCRSYAAIRRPETVPFAIVGEQAVTHNPFHHSPLAFSAQV
jgi:hypothetical protein